MEWNVIMYIYLSYSKGVLFWDEKHHIKIKNSLLTEISPVYAVLMYWK